MIEQNVIEMEQPAGVVDYKQRPMPVSNAPATPAGLLQIAVQRGASMEELERLMALQERYEANEARKAYVAAMAEFKSDPIEIFKDAHVSFKTDKGITSYNHASIGNVVEKIVSGLARHGFSHRWVPTRNEGGMISITCVITHKLGHSESTTLEAGLDSSGGKNNIQSMISTKTYLERHTLLAATGLATKEQEDDDGRRSEEKEREFQVQNFIDEAKKFTKDEPCLKYWNEHKPKFKDHPADFKRFKDEVAKHRAFIKEATQ